MNNVEKEIVKSQLNSEAKTLNELKQLYNQAKKDVEQKIAELAVRSGYDTEHIQQIIYQSDVQGAILSQINEALTILESNQYSTIEEFLTESYNTGYVGNMYSFTSQGIPILQPIDQKKVIRALTIDSKLSSSYYKGNPLKGRCAENIKRLKNSIRAEVSRGILDGSTWQEVAYKVASGMNSPMNKSMNDAMRIARTEGHRVNQQGCLDAGDEAVKRGADIVKQWDATLDGNTRPWHREADGQIREWNEDFLVNGEKMKAPSIGGSASNVINCRCQLLQRAKWALDADELQTLKDRAEFFGLDKTESFEEFKKKYLKLPDPVFKSYDVIDLKPSEIDEEGRMMIHSSWEEYRQKFLGHAVPVDFEEVKKGGNFYDTVNLGRYKDTEVINRIYNQLSELTSQFYSPVQKLTWMDMMEFKFSNAFASSSHGWGVGTAEIRFNPVKMTASGQARLAELCEKGYSVKYPKGKEIEYVLTHEFAHTILNIGESLPTKKTNFVQCDFSPVKKARKEIESIWGRYSESVSEYEREYETYSKQLDSKFIFEMIAPTEAEKTELNKRKEALDSVKISTYSLSSSDEFVAESFTDVVLNGDNASSYSKEVYSVLVKYFGKG